LGIISKNDRVTNIYFTTIRFFDTLENIDERCFSHTVLPNNADTLPSFKSIIESFQDQMLAITLIDFFQFNYFTTKPVHFHIELQLLISDLMLRDLFHFIETILATLAFC